MKIATYNVNGINGRLPVLLRWLGESAPDIVCLQELKAPQDRFPQEAILTDLQMRKSIWRYAGGRSQAITRPFGSNSWIADDLLRQALCDECSTSCASSSREISSLRSRR